VRTDDIAAIPAYRDFACATRNARASNFHETNRIVITASKWQVRQKITNSSVLRWRNYARFLGPLLHLAEENPS
jgi:hypothetical protein